MHIVGCIYRSKSTGSEGEDERFDDGHCMGTPTPVNTPTHHRYLSYQVNSLSCLSVEG